MKKDQNEENIYFPSLSDYDPGITKEKWSELLRDSGVTSTENLQMFQMMLQLGGESTCANLAETFGGSASSYNALGRAFGERVHKKTGCELWSTEAGETLYTIPFVGKKVIENGKHRYLWKLRTELKEALEEMDLKKIDSKDQKSASFDHNLILYGPPGTGKTYNSAIYAVAICDSLELDAVKKMPYQDVLDRYDKLKKEGRIAFTTFHQSYGYEEFIEGIKPRLDDTDSIGYSVEDGIFKKFCNKAGGFKILGTICATGKVWSVRNRAKDDDVPFDLNAYQYGAGAIVVESLDDTDRQCDRLANMDRGDLVVLGRNSIVEAIGVITDDAPMQIEKEPFHWKRSVNWIEKGLSVKISDLGVTTAFSNFAIAESKVTAKALQAYLNGENKQPYVFIIDEINRGNMSKIFGELITLIEDTKRAGASEAMDATLPYSGESFSVPDNVYILGTMNTADRSLALMDTALRRRFQFVEMMPNSKVLDSLGVGTIAVGDEELNVSKVLDVINQRIEYLFDREHTIGHAFFTKLAKDPSIDTLAEIFSKNVIPLLQEYFYEDYEKIQLVLGDNAKPDEFKFVLDRSIKVQDIFNGNPDIDLPEKSYVIQKDAFAKLQSYKLIGKDL